MSKRPLVEKLGQVSHQEIVDITLAIDETAVVSITDFTGKIQYVNDKFCEISKYSREELQEVDHRLINSGYHPPKFFKQMWGTIRRGKVWKGEIRNRAKDGKVYWMDTTIVPILQTQGKRYKYVSICKDITERKQAEEERLCLSSNARLHLPSEDKHTSRSRSNTYKELLQSEANMSRSHLSGSDNSFREAQRFFRFSPEMLCIVGFDGYFKTVNPAVEKILSYAPEELLSKSFLDFVHPEDKALTLAQLQKLSTKASTIQFENRYRCQDGSYTWLTWSASSVIEEGVMYAIARDITESKRVKATLLERSRDSTLEADVGAALSQSGTLPESLKRCTEAIVKHLDAIGVGIWTVDPSAATGTTDLLFLNLQASAGQLIPTDTFPYHLPPDHSLIAEILQTRQPVSTQLSSTSKHVSTGTGKVISYSPFLIPRLPKTAVGVSTPEIFFTGYPLIIQARLVGIIGLLTHQPLSDVVQSVLGWVANAIALAIDHAWAREELLSRREALLFRLASQIRNSLDLDTILGTAVTEIRSLLGVDGCHFLWCWSEPNRPCLSVTHEACDPGLPSLLGELPSPHLTPLAEAIRNLEALKIENLTQASNLDPEMRSLLRDWGIISGLLLPLKTHTGQLGAIVCSHYDGPRLWSDHEVELLQAVVDQLAIAIEHAELFAKTRAAVLAAQTQAQHLEMALQELKQAESRLIQTEKMSSLGQMVAGIAHEINNPVNFITGNLSHATNYIQDLLDLVERYQQHYPKPTPELQEYIEDIDLEFLIDDLPKILTSMQMGADRIHEIVISLRNFSRLDEAEMKPVNIHEGIDNTLLILQSRLKASGNNPGITIIKDYGNLPLVECYAGQLNQVFMNIVSNAIDALETQRLRQEENNCQGEGECDLSCPPTFSPTIWICTELLDSHQVIIRIRDNGLGIPENALGRLFDPFFTTKPVGKGTGLGLSISYQIVVEKHGGILKCLSKPGQGAEFWIQIPIAPQLPDQLVTNK